MLTWIGSWDRKITQWNNLWNSKSGVWLIAMNAHWSLSYVEWVMAVNEHGEFYFYTFLYFPPYAYVTVGCHFHAWRDTEGASMVVQWLRLCAPNGEGLGSIPGQGTRQCMLQLKAPSRCNEDQRSHTPQPRLSVPLTRQNQTSSEGCKIFYILSANVTVWMEGCL